MNKGIIATIVFIIIFIIDLTSNILHVKSYKKNKINKVLLFFIVLIILLTIEYIEDYITYNYLDNILKKDYKKEPQCEINSYWDAIIAGTSEEIISRLIIFNFVLIKLLKINVNTSIIISGILFGLTHITQYIFFGKNIYNTLAVIIQAIPSGMLFAYVYANTNLTTAIILHFLMDYIDFMLLRCNKPLYKKMLFIQ